MNSETPNLRQLPWIEQRACFKTIGKAAPGFRALRWHAMFLRLVVTGLVGFLFYSIRDQLGLMAFVGFVVTNLLVDLWIDRFFILPFAILHLEKTAEQGTAPNRA
jgi:hypothetical protein